MKFNNKSFQERYEAWKNGADYWKDIRGVNLGRGAQEEPSEEEIQAIDLKTSDILALYRHGKSSYVSVSPQLLYWDHMMKAGVDPIVAAGIAGNIQLESSFNHKASNGTHWGLVQTDRNLTDYIKKAYGDFSRDSLMNFIADMALGTPRQIKHKTYNEVLARSKAFRGEKYKTAEDAAKGWEIYFERSGGSAVGKRLKYASNIYNTYYKPMPTAVQIAEQNNSLSPIVINSPSTKQPLTINAAIPNTLLGPVVDLNLADVQNFLKKKIYEQVTTPTPMPNAIRNMLTGNNKGKDAYGLKFWQRRGLNMHFDEGKDPYLYMPGDYDFVQARDLGYLAGPDGHWPSRNYKTGRYLKSPVHPTLYKGIISDNSLGYYPLFRNGAIYTNTWPGNERFVDIIERGIQHRNRKR